MSFEVSFRRSVSRQRRLAQSSVCDDSATRNGGRGIVGRVMFVHCTFWSKMWFYLTGAGDRMVLEDRNVSNYVTGARNRTLSENRGRRSILWTLPKHWQSCVIRSAAGAGNPHHGCYVLREGLHFWNLNLRISLSGRCGISYDLGS